MFDIKLTDSEVKKALECCGKDDCDNCPNTFGNCYSNLAGYALDLINRKDFKIHQLEKTIMEIQNANLIDFKATIGNYIAENESLKAEIQKQKDNYMELLEISSTRADIISKQKAENSELLKKIKKLQDEYRWLDQESDVLVADVDNLNRLCDETQTENENLKAEVERLKSDVSVSRDAYLSMKDRYEYEKEKVEKAKQKCIDIGKALKTAKAEAYKECIEKVKEEIDNKEGHIEEDYALRGSWEKKYFYDSEIEDILDNLLNEFERKESTTYDD